MSIVVSVVVPTCNRPELLSRCLAALVAQDFDPAAYEIIIADDAASDETQRLVEYWAERIGCATGYGKGVPLLRYVRVTGAHGPAAARNTGWRVATGEIIAFTDDDCIPDSGWLSAGVAAFVDGVVGVSGRLIVPLPEPPTDYERNAAGLETAEFVTANCFYRRQAIAKSNGFDERFTTPWREDSDLFFTLLECGSQLVSAPDAIVVHPVRPAPWGVSLSQQRKSLFNALLYKKHPTLYRQRLKPVTPWHYYCIIGAMLVIIGAVLSGWYEGAIAALVIWILLTAHFCLRRLHQTSHAPQHIAEMVVTSALIPPLSVFWRIMGAFKFRVLFL